MERLNLYDTNCAMYKSFDLISKKWMLLILLLFWKSPYEEFRFTNFERMLPSVTSRVISMRLKELEEYKIIEKINNSGKITYKLTQVGINLVDVYNVLQKWTHTNGICDCNGSCELCRKIIIK